MSASSLRQFAMSLKTIRYRSRTNGQDSTRDMTPLRRFLAIRYPDISEY